MDSIKRRLFIKDMGIFLGGALFALIFPGPTIAIDSGVEKIRCEQSLFGSKRIIRLYGRQYRIPQNSKVFWKHKIKNEAKRYMFYYKRYSR